MKGVLTILLMLIVSNLPAWAALGDDVTSVDSDLKVLGGQRRVVFNVGYNMHEITTPAGGVVKEFVSPQGRVFGISWQGNSMPNLQQLLGSYAAEVQQAPRTQIVRRRGVVIQTGDLVFTSSGHMGSYQVRAYLLSLVPDNVTAEVVK